MLLTQKRASLHWYTPREEKGGGHLLANQPNDPAGFLLEASRGNGRGPQSNPARLGELFFPRRGQSSVSGCRQPCPASAAPMVERQTSESRRTSCATGSALPAPGLGTATAGTHDRQPLVCESMNTLERKPDARDGHVRFDERGVETGCMIGYSGTGNRKGRQRLRLSKHHRATPRLYKIGMIQKNCLDLLY